MTAPETEKKIPFELVATLSREMLARYALVSLDHNKIHLDDETAKKVGLPGVIAHGMLIAALVTERALRFIESNPNHMITSTQFRFKGMSFPGDQITVGGVCKITSEKGMTLELEARREAREPSAKQETVTLATITVQ